MGPVRIVKYIEENYSPSIEYLSFHLCSPIFNRSSNGAIVEVVALNLFASHISLVISLVVYIGSWFLFYIAHHIVIALSKTKSASPTPLSSLIFWESNHLVYLEIGWEIKDLLKKRILVIDGAMGTMVQRHKLEENDFR